MKPFKHARSSVHKYGGVMEDYQDIHDFIDSSKQNLPDMRHRALLHSSFGCYVVERVFGATRTNSQGKLYSPRDVAEDHIIEDMGFIPTLEKWFEGMPLEKWMGGKMKRSQVMSFTQQTQKGE